MYKQKCHLDTSDVKFSNVKHIAIIMDGNRRWAKRQGLSCDKGHNAGALTLRNVVHACLDLNIRILTAYSFSTENWHRPDIQVKMLFEIFITNLHSMKNDMIANGVKLETIGNIELLPNDLQQTLALVKEQTREGDKLSLVLALNYGGRDEVCRAVTKIIDDVKNSKLEHKKIDEALFSRYLDTTKYPDPDLVIRTASQSRLSNFLLYQSSYSELYVSDVLWPDFNRDELLKALNVFRVRKRKFGG